VINTSSASSVAATILAWCWLAMTVAAKQQNVPLSDFSEMRPLLRYLQQFDPSRGLGR
jgi:hypothetical protein